MMRLLHICESCGKKSILTPEEAYREGWDYPPKMGVFGVVGPRICGECCVNKTVWWAICVEKKTSYDSMTGDVSLLTRPFPWHIMPYVIRFLLKGPKCPDQRAANAPPTFTISPPAEQAA